MSGLFTDKYPYTDFHEMNLSWILARIAALDHDNVIFKEWKTQHEAEYEQLKAYIDAINAGNFPPEMVKGLKVWFEQYGVDIIGELVKMVFFGLTDDGHFVAFIPDGWDEIIFGTTGYDDMVPGIDFGHLTLSY